MIIKQLSSIGNSKGIILDKTLLDLIEADSDTFFKIEVSENRLILIPISEEEADKAVLKAAKKIGKKHHKTLAKLAK